MAASPSNTAKGSTSWGDVRANIPKQIQSMTGGVSMVAGVITVAHGHSKGEADADCTACAWPGEIHHEEWSGAFSGPLQGGDKPVRPPSTADGGVVGVPPSTCSCTPPEQACNLCAEFNFGSKS